MDIFFPNETEAISISGAKDVEEALAILSKKVPMVVITTGPYGAIATDSKQIWRHPAFDVSSTLPHLSLSLSLELTIFSFS